MQESCCFSKEALLRQSPEDFNDALIEAKIKPAIVNGQVKFVGVGRKTDDASQIHERFKDLGITANWSLFNGISDVRNNLEHCYADVTHESLPFAATAIGGATTKSSGARWGTPAGGFPRRRPHSQAKELSAT